jgi:GNAT superfamily N-acetyltransferase
MNYEVRKATLADREAIARLIAESARGLSREHYDDAQIEAAIASIFGVDTDLIDDGTYYVADQDGTLIGCGGWSRRKKLYGGDHFPIHDAGDARPCRRTRAIRSFFVHPDHARKGIARAMLSLCERRSEGARLRRPRVDGDASRHQVLRSQWLFTYRRF